MGNFAEGWVALQCIQHVRFCGTSAYAMTIRDMSDNRICYSPFNKRLLRALKYLSVRKDLRKTREMQTYVASGTHLGCGSLGREQLSLSHSVLSISVTARNCRLNSWRHEKLATCRAGRTFTCKVSQQASSAVSAIQKLKDDIREAAGPLNGLDRHVSLLPTMPQCWKESPNMLRGVLQGTYKPAHIYLRIRGPFKLYLQLLDMA